MADPKQMSGEISWRFTQLVMQLPGSSGINLKMPRLHILKARWMYRSNCWRHRSWFANGRWHSWLKVLPHCPMIFWNWMMLSPYYDHYQNVLRYCAAVWIFVTQSITPFEANHAQTFLSEAFQSWAWMDCHLILNCHNCQHLIKYILAYGPV